LRAPTARRCRPALGMRHRLRPAVAARVVGRLRCRTNDARAASGMDDTEEWDRVAGETAPFRE